MKQRVDLGALTRAAFFALTPAAAAGGAMALPVLASVAGVASFRPSLLRQAFEKRPAPVLLLAAFAAWALLSSAWSAFPDHTQALKLAILFPLGLLFAAGAAAPEGARLTRAAGLAAFIVLAVLLGIEAVGKMPLNRMIQPDAPLTTLERNPGRGLVVLLALAWAAAAGLLSHQGTARGGAVVVLAATALLATQFGQAATIFAFAGGLAAFATAFAAPRLAVSFVSTGLAAWMLAAPFLTPLALTNRPLVDAMPLSWAARAGVWDYVCARIIERPWIGHGLDASRAVTDRIAVRDLDIRGVPLHPHSASLQIWFETGLVGAALAAAAIFAGGWSLSRALAHDDRPAAAAAAGTIACLGVIANVSFGVWQEWWIATMFVAAAVVGAVVRARPPERHPGASAPAS